MSDRFSEARKRKNKGAYVSMALVGVFLLIVLLTKDTMAIFTMGLLLILFMGLLVWSVISYNTSLEHLKANRANLEYDVNSCEESVAGKYFFLQDCLADLANARLCYYSEIQSVRCIAVSGRNGNANVRRSGYLVEINCWDGSSCNVSDFQTSSAVSEAEKKENFHSFMELLKAHAPDAAFSDMV